MFKNVVCCLFVALAMAVAKEESRQWQEGSISGIDVIRAPLGLAAVDLSITTDTIVYEMQFTNSLQKKDLIPFVGIVTITERQKHAHLDVVVGAKVKFAISGEHGWLIDDHGVERKLVLKRARLTPVK